MALGRVLIVDDDPDITEAMKVVLENKGYQVSSAGNSVIAKINGLGDIPDIPLPGTYILIGDLDAVDQQTAVLVSQQPKYCVYGRCLPRSAGSAPGRPGARRLRELPADRHGTRRGDDPPRGSAQLTGSTGSKGTPPVRFTRV